MQIEILKKRGQIVGCENLGLLYDFSVSACGPAPTFFDLRQFAHEVLEIQVKLVRDKSAEYRPICGRARRAPVIST